jgi:hypothetical protein
VAAAKDVCADHGMRPHHRHFLVRQAGGLEQQRIGYPDFADVVQRRRPPDQADVVCRQAEHFCEAAGHRTDALGMLTRIVVPVFRGGRQPLEHLDARVLQLLRPSVDGFEQGAVLLANVLVEQPGLELIADAQRHLGEIEGLGQKVPGAERQGAVLGLAGNVAAHHEHGQMVLDNALLERLDHCKSVAIRHVQIENDQVGWGGREVFLEAPRS